MKNTFGRLEFMLFSNKIYSNFSLANKFTFLISRYVLNFNSNKGNIKLRTFDSAFPLLS